MRPLDDRRRRQMLAWSAICCAVPLCLAPLAGRSSFELAGERAAFDARFRTPGPMGIWNGEPVSVVRDPFVPEHSGMPSPVPGATPGVVGMRVTQGDAIGYAVGPGAAAGAERVSAVVIGNSPRALLDDGVRVRVIAIGDDVGGSRVVAIDGGGVRLQNGARLELKEGTP